MSDLRTRIAAAALDAFAGPGAWETADGDDCVRNDWLEIADAVIRELNLTLEESYGTTYPNLPVEDRRLTRWVTDWTADE